jgi:hypothetical protein
VSEAKIEIKIGQIQFSGQGEPDWVGKQLDKILAQAEKLIQLAPKADEKLPGDKGEVSGGKDASITKMTLAAFLIEKNAAKNQTKKFLATSTWLHAKGQSRLQPKDVTRALKASNQSRLVNPGDALRRNISPGYCERDGKLFFVTDEGKKSL